MALPGDALSTNPVVSDFMADPGGITTKTFSIEYGGIALNDPSEGLLYQLWTARIENNSIIYIKPENGEETILYVGQGELTEVSLTFDQNMRPTYTYVESGEAKFNWYDTSISAFTITNYGTEVINPRVSLDDKRDALSGFSDIILAYIKNGNLYHRRQRDRYGVEILLAEGVLTDPAYYLNEIGMTDGKRFQFEFAKASTQEDIIANMLAQAADPYTDIAQPYQVSGTVATVLTDSEGGTDSLWGPVQGITIYALQDPITGEYWVDTEGNLLVHTVEGTWGT